jgi:hypothetical protein
LYGPASLLLDDHAALPWRTSSNHIADPKGHDITSSQFTVQGHVEQRQVTEAALNLQSNTDAPNMHRSEREFRAALDGR